MDKQKKTRKHTFTLVELLVVLLILGVLVGLAVPRYMDAQKSARLRSFAANTREIESVLETYRLSNSTEGNKYPDDLSELTSYFTQPPINPYTGKNMLSDNPEESGLRYENHDNDYTLCVTQLDVDDVDKDGNKDESIPVASHIAKNDVGETCSVVTGTIEPFVELLEPFFRDDPSKEFINLVKPFSYTPIGIILDRTYIDTTTITIDPANELSAFQTEGDVSNDGNYMICNSGCEATTLGTFMIGSNNADDSVIEFTANIPEIETGAIDIGLTDFYLRYYGNSYTYGDTTYLFIGNSAIKLGDRPTGPHTFKFEFHYGRFSIAVDDVTLFEESSFYPYSFNESGTKFFVKNWYNTNAAVQIGTITITIDKYEFATTGTYISSIYDISKPNFITGTTEVSVSLDKFAQLEQYTDFTLEYQLSLDGGNTWTDWRPVTLYTEDNWSNWYAGVPNSFPENINLENARIRLRVTLSTNNNKFSPIIDLVYLKLYNALAQP